MDESFKTRTAGPEHADKVHAVALAGKELRDRAAQAGDGISRDAKSEGGFLKSEANMDEDMAEHDYEKGKYTKMTDGELVQALKFVKREQSKRREATAMSLSEEIKSKM